MGEQYNVSSGTAIPVGSVPFHAAGAAHALRVISFILLVQRKRQKKSVDLAKKIRASGIPTSSFYSDCIFRM